MRYVGDKHRQPIFFLSSDPSSACLLLLLLSNVSNRGTPLRLLRYYGIIFIVRSVWASTNLSTTSHSDTHRHMHTKIIYIYICIHIYQKTVYCTCSCCVPTACYDCTYSSAPLTQCCVTNRSTLSPPLCLGWQLFDFSISQTAPRWSS